MNKINIGFRGSDFIILTAIVLLIIGTAFTLGCLDDESDSDHDGTADVDDLCDDAGDCVNILGEWRLAVSNITSTNCVDRNDWGSDIVIDQY